ncbi:sensor histidine kinase [Lewinella sp. IMCC34191]|uniref:sensor histidine kinase n=1 Tax=Lewinella sp. IMCC34191 TaxID=2259172 RepID=UPI001300A6FF|nr:histidine kinase [Lewinella sp. IMCC34191]
MPLRFGRLGLWFLATYFVVLRLRSLLLDGQWQELFAPFDSLHSALLRITTLAAFAAYTFGAYLLLHRIYGRYGQLTLVLSFVLLILSCMLLRAFLEEGLLFAVFGRYNYNPEMSWPAYLVDNLYYAIIFLPVGIVFFFVQHGRHADAIHYQLETTYREAELKFLRSQVNPHFLFNTINNVYALVSTEDPNALPALEKLSGLLRYSLYGQEERVPLKREREYIEDLIHLEALRVPNLVPPEVTIRTEAADWQIPPLLLVPLVENACKHGRLECPRQPLHVELTTDEQTLQFTVVNAVASDTGHADEAGGIGLVNVRRRLELLYPARHTLDIHRTESTFRAVMTLQREAK